MDKLTKRRQDRANVKKAINLVIEQYPHTGIKGFASKNFEWLYSSIYRNIILYIKWVTV